jgi:hypothetical protein
MTEGGLALRFDLLRRWVCKRLGGCYLGPPRSDNVLGMRVRQCHLCRWYITDDPIIFTAGNTTSNTRPIKWHPND